MTGLEEFKAVLKEYRNLSLWAAGGSVALPFVASFVAVIPPWPTGLNVITAIFQFLALVFVYQRYSAAPRRIITRNITILFGACFVLFLIYIVLFSMMTIYVPMAKKSIIIGFRCRSEAVVVFRQKCPNDIGLDDLAAVAFDEFEIWTKASIALTRSLLIGIWFLFFICLASLIGKFLVFQMRRRLKKR